MADLATVTAVLRRNSLDDLITRLDASDPIVSAKVYLVALATGRAHPEALIALHELHPQALVTAATNLSKSADELLAAVAYLAPERDR